jgi:hypothetical protein
MSQRGVEQALGKLLTDEQFRERFAKDHAGAAHLAGLDLSADEVAAIARIPMSRLRAFCRCLDDRICRLHVPAPSGAEE